jgi:prepilin-type N-terminal cleavage/methylation domain-containing protein
MQRRSSKIYKIDSTAGYSMIEVLVVVMMIGILSAIALATYFNLVERARDVQVQTDLREIAIDLQNYAAYHGYPPDTEPGIEPGSDQLDPQIYFPKRDDRVIDYDYFCVANVRWAKIISYVKRNDDHRKPGAIGEWTRTGKDWALTLWIGKC